MSKDKKNLPALRSGFLEKVRQGKATAAATEKEIIESAIATQSRPRLLFAMDATASREGAWNVAKEITGTMFEAVPGALDVALAWHSGGRLQQVTPFSPDTRSFLEKVHAVRCVAGGTALKEILARATSTVRLKALIYIGDCFEENASEALELAKQLKLRGVRCFLFHDRSSMVQGYDVDTASKVFGEIARITGGALLPFDESAPELVKQLLEAIAYYAAQGMKALQAKSKTLPAARLLLEQMK